MSGRAAAVAALISLVAAFVPASSSATAPWTGDVALISRGLDAAAAAGRIDATEAAVDHATLARAARALPKLPSSRYSNLAGVVHEVAGLWKGYDAPRARTLFGMLDFNVNWFSNHWDRKAGTDVVAPDGVWYRAFPGLGFQFHPLENFGKLNFFVSSGNLAAAQQLAQELLDRAVTRSGGLAWEYDFRFGGGQPPWISGMAQAVAAQAFARAGALLANPDLTAVSRRAYTTVPSLLLPVASGQWIRLYAFSGETVLNAQLQAIISLEDYATATNDADAQALAERLRSAALGLLPRFDTGAWSLYSLGGPEAPIDYHRYVVLLLRILSARSADPVLTSYYERFKADLTQPPEARSGAAPAAIYPWPADGFRDGATISFWVSKRSTVHFGAAGHSVGPLVVARGWHTLSWSPGPVPPGTYQPTLHAVDVAGNASDTAFPPILVRRDTEPPQIAAGLRHGRLSWRATDDATPWLRLTVVLRAGGAPRTIALGRSPLHGSLRLKPPPGLWSATLLAADSSGNTTRVPLGLVRRRGG